MDTIRSVGSSEVRPTAGALRDRVQSLKLPASPEHRAGWVSGIAWPLALCLLAGNVVTGYLLWSRNGQAREAQIAAAAAPNPSDQPAVSPTAAKVEPGGIALEAKGYVVPAHQILVSPNVSGMVLSLSIEEGRRVAKGDVLAVLESTEYQADRDRAQATLELMRQRLMELEKGSRPEEIARARAELSEAEETLVDLERDFRRAKGLRERGVISEEEATNAESLYLSQVQRVAALRAALQLTEEGPRRERIEAARAEVRQCKADLARATWRLEKCTIRSPISGTILKKNAEEGNIVNPIAFNGSFSVCELADLSDLEVELDIQERDISRVFRGQKCRIRADAFPDRSYEGVVSRLMPIANRAKGAVPVRVKVTVPSEEQGVYLKPEMGAVVVFFAADAS